MTTLTDIEKGAKEYADSRDRLGATLKDLNDKIENLKRQYLPGIKLQVRIAAEKKLSLKNMIEAARNLFTKPRTVIIHGVKVGLKKSKGKIVWPKEKTEAIVKLIEKHFPDKADILVVTTKKPDKKALARLTAADLKKLGIEVNDTGDAAVIEPTDSDVEKWMDRLLKEKEQDAEEEAA